METQRWIWERKSQQLWNNDIKQQRVKWGKNPKLSTQLFKWIKFYHANSPCHLFKPPTFKQSIYFHVSDISVRNPLLIFLDKGFVLSDHIYLSLSKPSETPSDRRSPSAQIKSKNIETIVHPFYVFVACRIENTNRLNPLIHTKLNKHRQNIFTFCSLILCCWN